MANVQRLFVDDSPSGHRDTLDAVVREMCTMEVLNGRYLVQMPVMTQFGSLVAVSVWPEGDGETFMISDDGAAYQEIANALASEVTFSHVARASCSRYGAQFDGATMLFLRISKERLKGGIVAMATLIKEVVDETIEKSFAQKIDSHKETFVRRVNETFAEFERKEHVTIVGESTAAHDVDILVRTDHVSLAFDFFSKSGTSVNSAYLKLSDINRLEEGPSPVGVTPSLQSVGPKLNLIKSVARIVEAKDSVETYRRLAA